MSSSSSSCYWVSKAFEETDQITSVCIGTGRFLRSVLVPLLNNDNSNKVVLIQTRGRSFVDYMKEQEKASYPVDTVLSDGSVQTESVPILGVFSFGQDPASIQSVLMPKLQQLQLLGVGVTEQGLATFDTPIMKHMYDFLQQLQPEAHQKLCVVNTDNVPHNGQVLQSHMLKWATTNDDSSRMTTFLQEQVYFLDSMVDRITSQRDGDSNVPRAEPVPAKALVVLDPQQSLPSFVKGPGLVVRTTERELEHDIQWKLRIANGTHTAIAHLLALCGMCQTDVLAKQPLLMEYLDTWMKSQVVPAAVAAASKDDSGESSSKIQTDIELVWNDWRRRLTHEYFGLSSFFITQNGAAKGGIRFGPTVVDLVNAEQELHVTTAFAYAALLRWLTPSTPTHVQGKESANTVYTGWLNGFDCKEDAKNDLDGAVEYADGLRYNLNAGWYEFKCACQVAGGEGSGPQESVSLCLLSACTNSKRKRDEQQKQQPAAYLPAIRAYLLAPDGGNLQAISSTEAFSTLVQAIATLYARMVAGDDMLELLKEMQAKKGGFTCAASYLVDGGFWQPGGQPLHFRAAAIPDTSALMKAPVTIKTAAAVVASEVASTPVIDLHTHLLPPSHGPLCLWGIDELLTYHYLVAEFFMTAPADMTPEKFYSMTKQKQADIVWKALFIDRTPFSEASRGVVTTLVALGLTKELENRDLDSIRVFYRRFRDDGLVGAERFSTLVHKLSGVRYNIMTNIPFDPNEVQYWRPQPKPYPEEYRSALRVDPLLAGDRNAVEAALKLSGYATTLEGARQFLRDWCDTMNPEYLMASTPHNFVLKEKDDLMKKKRMIGINEDAMQQPGAFAEAISGGLDSCDVTQEDVASVIDEESDFLSEVLMKVCEERDLPVALKIGAHRGVNLRLKSAGDGVVAFADAGMLGRLCSRFPKVRFLATFLSRNNQHEACVLANKFGNLHIYGCWWYCFTPSIMHEITRMRFEMLGTAFTAQHSDARVLDQLIYKWSHSRAVIAEVVIDEVQKLCMSGWQPKREEIRRDIRRIFGTSYEEFMEKSLK